MKPARLNMIDFIVFKEYLVVEKAAVYLQRISLHVRLQSFRKRRMHGKLIDNRSITKKIQNQSKKNLFPQSFHVLIAYRVLHEKNFYIVKGSLAKYWNNKLQTFVYKYTDSIQKCDPLCATLILQEQVEIYMNRILLNFS